MRRLAPLALTVAALATPAAAQNNTPSQSEAAQAENAIVVTGDLERSKTVNRYIRTVMMREPAGQYARFEAKVCPSVIGFSDELETFMEERIRTVAEAAEVDVADKKCKPNLHLVIVDDGPSAIGMLRKRYRGVFGKMRPYYRDKLEKGEGPVYNWHVVQEVSSDDNARSSRQGSGFSAGGETYGVLGDDSLKASRTNVKSRVQLPVKQRIGHGFVLIERQAIIGLNPLQIADYAVMRGLLRAQEDTEAYSEIGTIMALFDKNLEADERPELLTEWDLALLTSLYKAPGDMNSDRQRSQMARTFVKVLNEGQ